MDRGELALDEAPSDAVQTTPQPIAACIAPGPVPQRRVLALQRAAGNRSTARMLARQPKTKRKSTSAGSRKTIIYRLPIDGPMSPQQLRDAFIRRWYSYDTEAEVATKRYLWSVTTRATTEEEVRKKVAILHVTLENQTDFDSLDEGAQKAVNDETDRRFYAKTGIKPGTKISAGDKKNAETWRGIRNAVLAEDQQRKQLAALPAEIKNVLFAGGPDAETLTPEGYTQALRIAAKLAGLSEEERQDYLERINASTTSLTAVEASVDRYLAFREDRDKQQEAHEEAARTLLGAEDLYALYRSYLSLQKTLSLQQALKGAAKDKGEAEDAIDWTKSQIRETSAKLDAALARAGFDSLAAFESALETYRLAFRTQAVNLALDVLAHYEHKLFATREKLDRGGAADWATGIARSRATQLFAEARRLGTIGVNTEAAGDEVRKQAEAEVIRATGNDPIVAERDVDREKLTTMDAAGIDAYLRSIIASRQSDVAKAREEFNGDPGRIFKLPDLVLATKKLQGIEAGTVYNSIVEDYIADERAKHILSELAKGILAIALFALVPVGGWVAAAALVGQAGLSAYQAYEAYREYEEQSLDYRLGFIQKEPSLVWVGLAIAGAALDLGMAASAVWKAAAPALKSLEGPLTLYAEGKLSAPALLAKIEAAEGLQAEVKAAMARELKLVEAEEAAVEAYQAAKAGKLYTGGIFDPALIKSSFRALYYAIRRGVNTIAKLRADAKLMKLMGEITGMTAASRQELELAFGEIKTIVNAGQLRKMDDATLLRFVDRWAINRAIPGYGERLLDEMRIWKPLSPEQQKAASALEQAKGAVSGLYAEKADLLEERRALLAQPRAARSEEVRERLTEINQRLDEIDPYINRPTVTKRVTVVKDGEPQQVFVQEPARHAPGEITRAEQALTQAEKQAAAVELTLYDRLRVAAPSEVARARALKGVVADQVGLLKTKPTGKLQVDHIVSVREIVDMDGFAELTWKEQKAIVDMKENLIVMDAAANASKGDRSWRAWKYASRFYDQSAIDKMLAQESQLRDLIRKAIEVRRPAARMP